MRIVVEGLGTDPGGTVTLDLQHGGGVPLPVLAAVMGRTLGEDFDHRKALVEDGLLEVVGGLLAVIGGGPGEQGRAGGFASSTTSNSLSMVRYGAVVAFLPGPDRGENWPPVIP